jgi:hypothetical protein
VGVVKKPSASARKLSNGQRDELLETLKARFDANPGRHEGLSWSKVVARLETNAAALWTLSEMERTSGQPDVVAHDARSGEVIFFDCSAETPKGRVSLCYDREGLESRREARPAGSAVEAAAAMGVELLDEDQYRALQQLGEFDLKTSSWLKTPAAIRALGGALFGDRRYDRVFTYHNGAQSYYAARAFRGALRV